MKIETARRMRRGRRINVPASRRAPAYEGRVGKVLPALYTNPRGRNYLWVEVENVFGAKELWPSHLLDDPWKNKRKEAA